MSRKSKELGLMAIDTHMGLFDYTVRTVIGEHDNSNDDWYSDDEWHSFEPPQELSQRLSKAQKPPQTKGER